MDQFHDLVAGADAAEDLRAHGLLANVGDERLHHPEVHVGLQQGQPDLPQRGVQVGLGQARLAAEAGYTAAFCGKVEGTPITRAGGERLAIARVGDDYVETLPGRGRRGLATILARKWRRRLGGA